MRRWLNCLAEPLPVEADNRLRRPLSALLDEAPDDWREPIQAWRHSPDGARLQDFVRVRQAGGATVYPDEPLRALVLTRRADLRVVIVGQDPYHGAGQAEGLAFSVPPGVAVPPSLRNILAEVATDNGAAASRPSFGHLGAWASQGVLLLNTVLTVEDGQPASHARQGWEALTDALIELAATDPVGKVFMLWGAHAQAKAPLITSAGGRRHLLLMANHPSPLSARRPPVPFVGCGHFRAANDWLGEARRVAWQP